jgi:hypothetical protein
MLTKEFKKWLTGEIVECCRHGFTEEISRTNTDVQCEYCKGWYDFYDEEMPPYRTFTTYQDLEIIEKLQEKEWWDDFLSKHGSAAYKSLPIILINPATFFPALQEWWFKNIKCKEVSKELTQKIKDIDEFEIASKKVFEDMTPRELCERCIQGLFCPKHTEIT